MKQSAGILVFRRKDSIVEVLLAHPGGPFWANKDLGAWSIPKGEFEEGEQPLDAARREFVEEIGQDIPKGELIDLGQTKTKAGKTIYGWAVEGSLDVSDIKSSTFTMEWPPKSGKNKEFPEVDRAGWFEISLAIPKMHSGQDVFLMHLAEKLNDGLTKPEQPSLF